MSESLSLAGVTRRFVIIRPFVSFLADGKDRLLLERGALVRRDGLGRHGRQIATVIGSGAARIIRRSVQGVFLIKTAAE
jgi:hypothetical protein